MYGLNSFIKQGAGRVWSAVLAPDNVARFPVVNELMNFVRFHLNYNIVKVTG